MMPSVFMGSLIHYEQRDFIQAKLKVVLLWLRPVLVGLIAVSAVTIGQLSIDGLAQVILFLVAFTALITKKVHPILVILMGALFGLVIF